MPEIFDRRFDRDLGAFHESAVDDRHWTKRAVLAPTEESRDLLEWSLRCREPDALWTSLAQPLQPLERQREVYASFCTRDRMDFIYDYCPNTREHASTTHGSEHYVQRLGRRDEYMRRFADHPRASRSRRVAGAHGDTNLGERLAGGREAFLQLRQRALEVPLNVVVERLER